MRGNILLCAVLLIGNACYAQTQADYERALQKIGKYYNRKDTDSLLAMYAVSADKRNISIWQGKQIDELKIRYGKMRTYDYAGEENGVMLFKTEFTRSTHIVGLQLDKDDKLLQFRFKVESPLADSLLNAK